MDTNLALKDTKYFLDGRVYNCPFCQRGSVAYLVAGRGSFDWSNSRTVYYYRVECQETECNNVSLHMSNHYLQVQDSHFVHPPKRFKEKDSYGTFYYEPFQDDENVLELDDAFFFSIPNASFTIDSRIPSEIRAPLVEASECLKNNFLIGASGCIRKAVYKLLRTQEIPQVQEGTDKFLRYEDRIDLLKTKLAGNRHVHAELLDSLKGVHGLTSQELHENDWNDFSGPQLKFLGELVKELLYQIYIEQDEVEKRQAYLRELQAKASGKTNE